MPDQSTACSVLPPPSASNFRMKHPKCLEMSGLRELKHSSSKDRNKLQFRDT
jgi:hypothetical protein